ncbi:MAG TPA: DNA polymerase III subunit delta' [Steroidobacteraceae bacterium]|nr:DNA polymerase III subunit delta' [Steroidobacteraceae bacterium]
MSPPSGVPPWLAAHAAALLSAREQGRMPHALLIHEAPGTGGDWLAGFAAALVLCRAGKAAPCGECAACRRVAAQAHPDVLWLRPQEDSRQIRIEQVRELAAELALTSHGGGYKVGAIIPADAMNRYAANALLKTLEEPPPQTLLILVASEPSRLPPTAISRCQRLRIRAPRRAESVAWLTAVRGKADWDAALDTLGEAPMQLLQLDPAELAAVGTDVRDTLESLASGRADPVAAAERWARSQLPLRLLCFENWLTERIREAERRGALLPELRPGPYLSGAGAFLNIRELFGLMDEVRDQRATLDVPLNRGMALEALFRRIAPTGGVRNGVQG